MFMYEKNSAVTTVNAARQKLFSQRCKAIENIPPTQDALRQHTLRAAYQSFVCGQCLHRAPGLPFPSACVWIKDEGQPWKPLWTIISQVDDSCYELIHCSCKQSCKTRCKCAAANLPCTALCYCGGDYNAD